MVVKGVAAVFWRYWRWESVGRAMVRVRGRSRVRKVVDSIVVVCGCVVRVMEDGLVECLWKEDDGRFVCNAIAVRD